MSFHVLTTPSLRCLSKHTEPDDYILQDRAAEKKFGFSLQASLKAAREAQLLEGKKIFMTEKVLPPPSELAPIVELAGMSCVPEGWGGGGSIKPPAIIPAGGIRLLPLLSTRTIQAARSCASCPRRGQAVAATRSFSPPRTTTPRRWPSAAAVL